MARIRTNKPLFVYFVASEQGHCKIGYTDDVCRRISNIRMNCPIPLRLIHSFPCEAATDIEQLLHRRFKSRHIHGEWFYLNEADIQEISRLTESLDSLKHVLDQWNKEVHGG